MKKPASCAGAGLVAVLLLVQDITYPTGAAAHIHAQTQTRWVT